MNGTAGRIQLNECVCSAQKKKSECGLLRHSFYTQMERYTFITLFLSAVFSLSACVPWQYHFVNQNLSWTESQRYCRENYTDLVTINNKNDIEELLKSVNDDQVQFVWIGLHKTNNKTLKWSLGDPAFYTGNDLQYRNWTKGQPNDNEDCSKMNTGGWFDSNHSTQHLQFICYNDELVLIRLNVSWNEALRYCRENHVDLVSVHSEQIQCRIMNVVKDALTAAVWMGLHHSCTLGLWFWVNGQILCYQNWAAGHGTGQEDCSDGTRVGAVQSEGDQQWISLPQTHKLNFICTNRERERVNQIPLSKTSKSHLSIMTLFLEECCSLQPFLGCIECYLQTLLMLLHPIIYRPHWCFLNSTKEKINRKMGLLAEH
ncbi:C-type mannose receptor 2-like [Xyrauchen texanus]|uniref:C-type mannose receptor 2-like n=1 Tax=Xyrauchen texanus TaxID=154827 RepID=UPI002241BCDC|nr:C-type mannose receptor 2-like [Xyrauchen texanus]